MSPKRLVKNIATNQIVSPFFADFQRPIPFQKDSQITKTKTNIPKSGNCQLNIFLLYTIFYDRDFDKFTGIKRKEP